MCNLLAAARYSIVLAMTHAGVGGKDRPAEFRSIIQEFSGRLLAVARLYLGSDPEAEDVVQTTFLKAWQNWDEVAVRDLLEPWLFRVARNHCIDVLRRRRHVVPLRDIPSGDPDCEASEPAREFTLETVIPAIRRLDEPYRTVLILRFSQKMPYEKIAETLDIPLGTVKSQICRAVRLLKAKLQSTFQRPT